MDKDIGNDKGETPKPIEVYDLGKSMLETKFYVPRAMYGGIIGSNGRTKNRIQAKWGIKLTLPERGSREGSMVSIQGKTRENVCDAKKELEELVNYFRGKSRPTHFVCVPAYTEDMTKAFNRIKEDILSNGFSGIDESLFIDAKKIHITCALCTLLDSNDQAKAIKVFKECCQDFKDKESPIQITIRGLTKFDREPITSVRVIYANINSPSLQAFADGVIKRFKEAGLNSVNQKDSATLHMTVMNVKYRLGVNRQSPKNFDATEVLEKYAEYDFGTLPVTEIHLSQMGTTDKNGFYEAVHVTSFLKK